MAKSVLNALNSFHILTKQVIFASYLSFWTLGLTPEARASPG